MFLNFDLEDNYFSILRLELTSISEADRKLAENYQCVICQMITYELMVGQNVKKTLAWNATKTMKDAP